MRPRGLGQYKPVTIHQSGNSLSYSSLIVTRIRRAKVVVLFAADHVTRVRIWMHDLKHCLVLICSNHISTVVSLFYEYSALVSTVKRVVHDIRQNFRRSRHWWLTMWKQIILTSDYRRGAFDNQNLVYFIGTKVKHWMTIPVVVVVSKRNAICLVW